MRKVILGIILYIMSTASGYAQNADARISELINTSNWFGLRAEYPVLKDSIQYPFVVELAESMINYHFNRPAEANANIDTLLAKYQAELGVETSCNLMLLSLEMMANEYGQYDFCAGQMQFMVDNLKAMGVTTELDMEGKEQIAKHYEALKECPPIVLERHDTDTEVPISIERAGRGTIIYIPVTVHGETYKFIFDTGASSTYMHEDFAKKVGVKILSDSILLNAVYTSPGYAKNGYLDSMQIGDMTLKNAIVYIGPANEKIDTVFRVDAVLGMDFIKRVGEVQIYPSQNKIIFPANSSPLPSTGSNISLHQDGHTNAVTIKAKSGDEYLEFLFDSGNVSSDFTAKYFNKHKEEILATCKPTTIKVGGFNMLEEKTIYKKTILLQVGDTSFELKNVDIHTGQTISSKDGALGMSTINLFDKVVINFKDMFIEFK